MLQVMGYSLINKARSAIGAATALILCTPAFASDQIVSDTEVHRVRSFLQEYLGSYAASGTTYISVAGASLHDQSRDFLVYVSGHGWCGSGGCSAILLEQEGETFRVVSKFTLVQLPVDLMDSKTRGWQDIAIWVG